MKAFVNALAAHVPVRRRRPFGAGWYCEPGPRHTGWRRTRRRAGADCAVGYRSGAEPTQADQHLHVLMSKQ
jgi:hypothetical protein